MAKEPTNFALSKVETISRQEKETTSVSLIYLDLKLSRFVDLAKKPYHMGYVVPSFINSIVEEAITRIMLRTSSIS